MLWQVRTVSLVECFRVIGALNMDSTYPSLFYCFPLNIIAFRMAMTYVNGIRLLLDTPHLLCDLYALLSSSQVSVLSNGDRMLKLDALSSRYSSLPA